MKREERIVDLIKILDSYINNDEVDSSVSPTLGSGGKTPVPLTIIPSMNVEVMTQDELASVHYWLHEYYRRPKSVDLTKRQIRRLHMRVSRLMDNHVNYDRLDKSGKNKRSIE